MAAKIFAGMKYVGIGFTLVLILIFALTGFSQMSPSETQKTPKVVMGIVVENMRPDYIQRYWNKFEENGFKKLYTQGAVCTNVRLIQQVQNYASGTATLFTGVNPSMHGIINKNWYDKFNERETECTEDSYYITVGADTKAGNASPKKLLSNTITDILKIYSMGKSKVFSVALNRESAIFSAGHAANGAYWFDIESGRMISSSFYVNMFPDWVRLFNSENYAEKYS
ncbi:MAG TPA: alkaline phosphatase family protein, partial [Draconibacterium sp.]|nr:alkaline phosphatase family protein [Draconibacterium sp.]